VLQRLEELDVGGRHAAHQLAVERGHAVQSVALGQHGRMLGRGLEVLAVLDQFDAQRAHGGVLLDRVAVRHHDGRGQAMAARREAQRLAMVAARGADHVARPGLLARQRLEVGQAAADLEGADRRVVLVLGPQLRAQAPLEQRPGVLRRGRHGRVHGGERGFHFFAGESHGDHFLSVKATRTASAASTLPIT
jgi:hypothetical protein